MTDTSTHWNEAYRSKPADTVSWFDAGIGPGFEAISRLARPGDAVLDVGGGASELVDRLLDAGFGPLSVLDLSETALQISRTRLGARADAVAWHVADITDWTPPQRYGLWHDRAVFHFLTDPQAQARYLTTMMQAIEPSGHAVLATFAEDGPLRCSGLPVQRYSPADLAARLAEVCGDAFTPLTEARYAHVTPAGATQRFQISTFQRG